MNAAGSMNPYSGPKGLMLVNAINISEPTTNPRTRVMVKNIVVRFAQRCCWADEKPPFLAVKTPLAVAIEAQTNRTTEPGMTQ